MIVALDIGLKRIGVAFGYENKIAIPQNAVLRKNRNQAALEISKILKENNCEILVVGVPIGGNCEEEMKRRIQHFVSLLDFGGEIVFVDESFSSFEANELKVANTRKKDGKLDSLSAMIILQRFFEKN